MGDTALATAVATVIATAITGLAGWATQKSAANAAAKNAAIASRTEVEKEAFERAKEFYTEVIDRQGNEIHELEADIGRLKKRVGELEAKVKLQRSEHERITSELMEELQAKRDELATAKRALSLKFPDEP